MSLVINPNLRSRAWISELIMSMLAPEPVLEDLYLLRRRYELAHKENIRLTTTTAGVKEDIKVIELKLQDARRSLADAQADLRLFEEKFVPEKLTGLAILNPFAQAEINRRNFEQREKYLGPIDKYTTIVNQLEKNKLAFQKHLQKKFDTSIPAEPDRKEEFQKALEAKMWQTLAKTFAANQDPEPVLREVRTELRFSRQRYLWEYIALLWSAEPDKLVTAHRDVNNALSNQTLTDCLAALVFWIESGKTQLIRTEHSIDNSDEIEIKLIMLIKALTNNMVSLDMAPDFNTRNILASILMFTQRAKESQLLLEKISPGLLPPPVRELLICLQVKQGNITKAKQVADVEADEALSVIYPSVARINIWRAYLSGAFSDELSKFYEIAPEISAEQLLFALTRTIEKRDLELFLPVNKEAYYVIREQ